MAHYRSLLDHEFLGAWDLAGPDGAAKEATFTVGAVTLEDVVDPRSGAQIKKLCITPRERQGRKLILNKTNADLIAALHGTDCDKWVGQRITIYPAQTAFGSSKLDCIRVRVPKELLKSAPTIRPKVKAKMLAELDWTAAKPQTKAERLAAPEPREPGSEG